MNHEKSLLLKTLMTVIIPVALVLCLVDVISMYVIGQSFDHFAEIQNNIILINVIGLGAVIVAIVLGLKGTSNQITKLAEFANHLADGDVDKTFNVDKPQDQLGEIEYALASIAENLKLNSDLAQNLAVGNFSETIASSSKNDSIGKHLQAIQNSVKNLLDYMIIMPELVEKKVYLDKSKENELSGDYKKAIEQVNQAMATVVYDKDYYLAILDALPYRITTSDNNMKMVFVNKTLEDLMKLTGTAESREAIRGHDCSSCKLEMCGTENCGYTMLKAGGDRLNEFGYAEYSFAFMDRYYRMDTAKVLDKNGEQIGYVEVSHDTTPVMSVNNYTSNEVVRLAENLHLLSAGNLEFDLSVTEPNQYTNEAYEQFQKIGTSLTDVKSNIGNLINDASMLTNAAISGELSTRADETKFSGSWQQLISGMNNILGEIAKPIEEVSEVMSEISKGQLKSTVNGFLSG